MKRIDSFNASNRGKTINNATSNLFDVVVIGGGDTAMDCVRTSIRQNAKSVKCLYRRDKKNMPGSLREVYNAEEEGVEFIWLSSPKKFIGKNKIESLAIDKIKLGDPDDSGRRKPEVKKNSEFNIKADMVIKALGFDPENLPKLFNCDELQVTRWGTIKTDFDTMETNIPGIFAAGDIIRGASLVVWAIRDGREAAISIKKFLGMLNWIPAPSPVFPSASTAPLW